MSGACNRRARTGLQAALSAGRDDALHLYVFDLLHMDGWDLRGCALADRKRLLEGLADWKGAMRYSGHYLGQAAELHAGACRMGLEAIVCKRADALYKPGRGSSWVKLKCAGREEFVVLGWSPPDGSRVGIGSLNVGYYDPDGHLHYAGGVGTGFSDSELLDWRARLDGMEADAPEGLLYAGDPIDGVGDLGQAGTRCRGELHGLVGRRADQASRLPGHPRGQGGPRRGQAGRRPGGAPGPPTSGGPENARGRARVGTGQCPRSGGSRNRGGRR